MIASIRIRQLVGRSSSGRLARLLALSLVAFGLPVTWATPIDAGITKSFAPMFSVNTSGDIQIRGNTLMTCQSTATNCAGARNGTATGGNLNNNSYFMTYVDEDGGGSSPTFNSSSATVAIPPGASVLYAALSWGGSTSAGAAVDVSGLSAAAITAKYAAYGNGTVAAAPTPASAGQVMLKGPGTGAAYQTITSERTTFLAGSSGAFQGYVNVTSIVAAAGNGSYTVANVQSGTGTNQYAGWALTIAYSYSADPPRNLTVFAGFGSVAATNTVDIAVSGFQTPLSGDVKTTLGAISYEGDAGSVGDQLQLGNSTSDLKNVSDALHPVANTFYSAIADGGSDGSVRSPKYKNQLGYDQATFVMDPATHYLTNNASNAVIRLTSNTGGETYYPGVITFATELYAPNLVATKSVVVSAKAAGNVQSGVPEPGDTLRYTVNAMNAGADDAINTIFVDAIPAETTYVPGSLSVGGVPRTDAPGDDTGYRTTSPSTVRVNLGTGAGTGSTSTSGGTVVIGAAIPTVTFDVTVNDTIGDGAAISNVAEIRYTGYQNGLAVAGASNAVVAAVVRRHSALSVTKTANVSLVQRGAATPVTYTLTAANSGPYDEPGVTITDALPPGAVLISATPSAGTCTAPAGGIVCAVGALANAGSASVVVVLTLDGVADPATDTATVAGENVDDDPGDSAATLATSVNTAPVAASDAATTTGGSAVITVLANDADADSDPLAVTPGGTAPTKGSVRVDAAQTITYTADAGAVGVDTFTYTLSDGRGGTSSTSVQITIPNAYPVAHPDAATTTPRAAIVIAVLTNDSDPNIPTSGQALSVVAVTQPSSGDGIVTLVGGIVTFTPNVGSARSSATFTYTVADGAGGSAVGTVTVDISDVAPRAGDDTAATPYLTAVTVDVLINDSDDNGDPITVTAVGTPTHGTATIGTGPTTPVVYTPAAGWSGVDTVVYTITDGTTSTTATLTVTTANAPPTANGLSTSVDGGVASVLDPRPSATDPNTADVLTVIGAAGASHGTVAIDGDGNVVYTPNAGYAGADSFTYTVSDGHDGTSSNTVSITVRNQAPDAVDDAINVPLNRSVVVPVLTNDTDPNADAVSITAVSSPAHGTAVINIGGTITYTPAIGYLGADAFTYSITDGHGAMVDGSVDVTVANQSPVALDDTAIAWGAAGSPITIDVILNDGDPNDDPIFVLEVSLPAHGTAEVDPDGRIIYVPQVTYAGTDVFTYTISDGRGALSIATITIQIGNRDPVAVADDVSTVWSLSSTFDVLANDTDPDGEPLSVLGFDAVSAHGGSVVASGDGLRYTAAPGFVGADAFGYTVTDPRGGTATALVTVTVSDNEAPTAGDDSATVVAGRSVVIDVRANDDDADGDVLTVTAVSAAAHGTVTLDASGTITYTPFHDYSGSDSFGYEVSDGRGRSATAVVTLMVDAPAPTSVADTSTTTTGPVSSPPATSTETTTPASVDDTAIAVAPVARTSPASGANVALPATGGRLLAPVAIGVLFILVGTATIWGARRRRGSMPARRR